MTLMMRASRMGVVIASVRSLLALGFGITLFLAVPHPSRYFMLLGCGFAAVVGPIEVIYNRLEITDRAVIFRSVFRRWSLPLGETQNWNIKGGNSRSLSLHFSTSDGRKFCVPDLSMLGVRDHAIAARSIAKCLRQYRRGISDGTR
jgi:hypothetical protein